MPGAQGRVLLVEDDVYLRMVLSAVLAEAGYSVCTAADGLLALAEIDKHAPDVILSDLNMPRMSGFELLPIVRRNFPTIRLVAMSGAFTGDGVPQGVTADAFYEKGGSLPDLLQTIGSMVCPTAKIVQSAAGHSDCPVAARVSGASSFHIGL